MALMVSAAVIGRFLAARLHKNIYIKVTGHHTTPGDIVAYKAALFLKKELTSWTGHVLLQSANHTY